MGEGIAHEVDPAALPLCATHPQDGGLDALMPVADHRLDTAIAVATAVAQGEHDRAVLICGTGIGVCISANKVRGIRAAQAHDCYSAERAQKSNDAQIICLGARVIGPELARSVVSSFLGSSFEHGRSGPKVDRIIRYEKAQTLTS
ncbi:MAG: RpiB/LacA/LacB family sugar-phosphate isomerase [Rhodobacter sp.]|nr:RpiB/LacA/LacB family sugar-phosphate isomerase [Rhodobacter sp.]